jgi:hypothetical protein
LLTIEICPLAAPADVGLNCTCNVVVCCGFNVSGRLAPTIVKLVPVTATELTVTGAVPVDVSVSDCVDGVLSVTLPKLTLEELTDN